MIAYTSRSIIDSLLAAFNSGQKDNTITRQLESTFAIRVRINMFTAAGRRVAGQGDQLSKLSIGVT